MSTNADTVSQYPATIILDPGGSLEGRFKYLTRGHTRDGDERAIAVIEVDGVERSLWLLETALRGQLRQVKPKAGELIRIEKGAEKRESSSGYKYWPVAVSTPERPAAGLGWDDELLGGDDDGAGAAPTPAAAAEAVRDEDIPF